MKDKYSKHSLSKGLVECLVLFHSAKVPVKVKDLLWEKGLSFITNSVKLKHWGFIVKVTEPANHWRITKHGEDFLHGLFSVPKSAITLNDDFIRYEGNQVYARDIKEHFKKPIHHIYETNQDDGQATLF